MVQGWGRDGGGLQVGKQDSADKQGDHGQVREARGKGFVPARLRGHPQHCPEDLHIGQHNENKATNTKRSTKIGRASCRERVLRLV